MAARRGARGAPGTRPARCRNGGPAASSSRPVRLATGPSHYLTGESSALVRALSGGPALPETRRRPTAEAGIGGRPTLVQNVETLARVGLLARTGVDGHRPTCW